MGIVPNKHILNTLVYKEAQNEWKWWRYSYFTSGRVNTSSFVVKFPR